MGKEILTKVIDEIIFYDLESPYARIKSEVNRIDNDYFEEIQRDSEELPAELCPELRDKVLEDFKQKIASILCEESCRTIFAKIQERTEECHTPEIATELAGRLRAKAQSLDCCNADLAPFEKEIQHLYHNARTRTIAERVMRNNKNDVIDFHHALQRNTVSHVRNLSNMEMKKFIEKLAEKFDNLKI